MQRDVKGEAGIRPAKKPWEENEVGSTGNREKFGQALYCAEDDCLKDVHRLTCTLGTRRTEYSPPREEGWLRHQENFGGAHLKCRRRPPLLTRRGNKITA